ncbi:Sec-independent protein translocase protein TatB [Malaciobacter marinus]|uniref:Sec-independent protein translocase protein TatB homolog n=1 Tax=Malaciobacter marinus TaxID=505249 RepID=A0A347TL01_9BACT|nr:MULTISPECIES: Sec-independent protein translocase protein TatB [Malaciobacter]AXX87279.1 twin arginine translocation system, TatB protein [Malaciobacter marinus]PHO11700.1 twin-arginine translocase subunit TatB [Malaciobacter marinus]PHO15536.1 twin-arginine translocase subunit TatB [Malaciobacter marinus]RYA22447.1 twin-arginine translocase subunit TatB [Malaciobacter halophilus]
MFGMGFFEITLVAVIAIIALGPEKLPKAMVEIARFLKKFKSGVEDAKSTLDNELSISEMREEANKFKAQIEDAKSSVNVNNMDLGLNDIMNDTNYEENEVASKKEVTSKKEKKKKKKSQEKDEIKNLETNQEEISTKDEVSKNEDPSNKFKVKFDDEKVKEDS